jgi:transglutaminase-like putative cysteine protease
MRLKIRHQITCAFTEPARSALYVLRLTPRNSESQFIRRWRIDIDGDARLDRGEDAYGNVTHTVFVEGPLDRVQFNVDGEVDTADPSGIVRGTAERLPLPVFLRQTPLTTADPDIAAFARDSAAAEARDPLATMHSMMQRLAAGMTFEGKEASFAGSAKATFATQTGNAHDGAHLLITAARSLGTPARFVTGYVFDGKSSEPGASHAWMEAAIPRVGWIGFDVTRGLCVTDRYVRVASGLDYLDAAPVRGAGQGGEAEAVSTSVQVEQGRQVVES